MRHKARDSGSKFDLLLLLCRHIGLLFCKRLDTNLLRHRIHRSKISGFTRPHVIGFFADIYFFPLWRADLKIPGFAVEFSRCVWTVAVSGKKKVADSKISGYVWTVPEC